MQLIPLAAIPAQTLSIVLALQNCEIGVTQRQTGLYFDLSVNGVSAVRTRICRDRDFLIDQPAAGVIGNFRFNDLQGLDDPEYSGLGTRWVLTFHELADL